MDDFDEGDSYDEINEAATGKPTPKTMASSGGTPCPQSKGGPMLHLHTERNVYVDPGEERDLIRRLQAGDDAAKTILVRGRIAWLTKECGQNKYAALPFEERFAVAAAALAKGYATYNLKRNSGLTAFITKAVNGAICDAITNRAYGGIKNESRAARADRDAHRPTFVTYNSMEGSHDDGDGGVEKMAEGIPGWISADDGEVRETTGCGGKVTDEDWQVYRPATYEADQANAYRFDTAAHVRKRLTERFARLGRALDVPRECIGVDENPRSNGGRASTKFRWESSLRDFSQTKTLIFKDGKKRRVVCQRDEIPPEPQCDNPLPLKQWRSANPTPKRFLINAPIRGNAAPLGIIGYLAKDVDLRAIRRLKQVGRRQYALELAAKDRKPIRPVLGLQQGMPVPIRPPAPYSISVNTAATASPEDGALKAKLRIIEGTKNGKFTEPGPLDHAVSGNAHGRVRGGNPRDIRPRHRARS
jgi:hypothetical protein